jgi:hypothetical protein
MQVNQLKGDRLQEDGDTQEKHYSEGSHYVATSERTLEGTKVPTHSPARARGGLSIGGVLTGVVVAFGAMFLLSGIIGGILAAIGISDTNVTRGEAVQAGIAGGIAYVIAMFLAYLWGGYTAGRMARGAGALNGVLVPIVAIVLALIVGAITAALGATANLNLPFTTARLPIQGSGSLVDWGIGLGVAALIAMAAGGIMGGSLGSRWHTKLETREETHLSQRSTDSRMTA